MKKEEGFYKEKRRRGVNGSGFTKRKGEEELMVVFLQGEMKKEEGVIQGEKEERS